MNCVRSAPNSEVRWQTRRTVSRVCAVVGSVKEAATAASLVRRNMSASASVAPGPVTAVFTSSPSSTTCARFDRGWVKDGSGCLAQICIQAQSRGSRQAEYSYRQAEKSSIMLISSSEHTRNCAAVHLRDAAAAVGAFLVSEVGRQPRRAAAEAEAGREVARQAGVEADGGVGAEHGVGRARGWPVERKLVLAAHVQPTHHVVPAPQKRHSKARE